MPESKWKPGKLFSVFSRQANHVRGQEVQSAAAASQSRGAIGRHDDEAQRINVVTFSRRANLVRGQEVQSAAAASPSQGGIARRDDGAQRMDAVSPLLENVTTEPEISGAPAITYGINALHEDADAFVDIVFVHGLTGNAYNTWLHQQSSTFSPRDLLPKDIRGTRVYSFSYDADIAN